MTLRSTLFASAALLAFVPSQLAAQEAGVGVDAGVGVGAAVAPGTIVIERGDDRIVIAWNGKVPSITVNGSKVGASKLGAKKRRPTVIDGYTVHAPALAEGFPLPTLLAPGSRVSDFALRYVDERKVPLAYKYLPKAEAKRYPWGAGLDVADGDKKRPYIGVQVGSVPGPLADHLGLDAGNCVLILSVTKGGGAEQAGLRKNDILLGVDGGEAVTDETLRAAVREKKAGDQMLLRILRRGKERELKVEVGEQADAIGRYWGTVVDPKTLNGYWDATPPTDIRKRLPSWNDTLDALAIGKDQPAKQVSGIQKELAAIQKQLAELKKLVAELRR